MDIPDEAMTGIRSASEPYAKLLASQIRQRFSTDWGLSETGATGPTGNRYGDAAGHSCMAVAGPQLVGDHVGDRQRRPARQHACVCGNRSESAAAEFVAVNYPVVSATNRHRRPRGSGDPYAAALALIGAVRRLSRNNKRLWLWVPASAGTTRNGNKAEDDEGDRPHFSRKARIN